jgi:hypothetical protein
MPRCHIYHKPTGTLLARDLYENFYPWLLDYHDGHEVVPHLATWHNGEIADGLP